MAASTFSGKGKKWSDEQLDAFQKLKKPEICDSLESVQNSLYVPDERDRIQNDYKKMLHDVVINIANSEKDDGQKMKNQLIDQFVTAFQDEMMRPPELNEICSNMISKETQISKEDILFYKDNATENTIIQHISRDDGDDGVNVDVDIDGDIEVGNI